MMEIAHVTGRANLPPPERLFDLTLLEQAWRELTPGPCPGAAMTPSAPTPVSLLPIGADIVTFDDRDTVVCDGAIAIDGDSILWIGPAAEAAARLTAIETLRAFGLIAMRERVARQYHTLMSWFDRAIG